MIEPPAAFDALCRSLNLMSIASVREDRLRLRSSGDDSLYAVNAESRTATIKVGKAPVGVAVDPTTQTAYVTSGNAVSSNV